jgi:hypothetical protein
MNNQQEAEFYVTQPGWESVWEGEHYYVIRNGDMRIHFGNDVIRYTDQLVGVGIGSDRVLSALNISSALAETHDLFQIIDSPWFEVVDREGEDDLDSEVYHTLDEAVERAQRLELDKAGTL